MDLLRSTISTVFYHLSIEAVANAISGGRRSLIDEIADTFCVANLQHTQSEIELLKDIILQTWATDERGLKALPPNADDRQIAGRLPLILNRFASSALRYDSKNQPEVKFQHLLRWHDTTHLIGEDILTLPFLAKNDLEKRIQRKYFCWPNVIGHDNFRLNAIIKEHLSDTHNHINASQDVFEFNWLAMMNHPDRVASETSDSDPKIQIRDGFRAAGHRMEYDMASRIHRTRCFSLNYWIRVAAAIRVLLFQTIHFDIKQLKGEEFISPKEIVDVVAGGKSFSLFEKSVKLAAAFSRQALKAEEELVVDYAIQKSAFSDRDSQEILKSPFTIHQGERSIIYGWFHSFYRGDSTSAIKIAPLVMLYLLIKSKARREFVQTNRQSGFANFQIYQKLKTFGSGLWSDKRQKELFERVQFRYAVQSCMGERRSHSVEARLTPSAVKNFRAANFRKAIFGNDNYLSDSDIESITIVPHFIKCTFPEDQRSALRHQKLRAQLFDEAGILIEVINQNDKILPPVTGIDAASSELACRPEVFAPVFRYMRAHGLPNFTFHAGEDFYDILDGLRTIAETIDFMGYTIGCRIGHGLALGLDAKRYYESRHRMVLLPRQVLLDNLVWMKYFAKSRDISLSRETELLIEENYIRLVSELGYGKSAGELNGDVSPDMWSYWQSMRMRGDYIAIPEPREDMYSLDVMRSPVSPTRDRDRINRIRMHYETNLECRRVGNQPEMVTFPKSFARDVVAVQSALLDLVEDKGIVIETNPTSNIKIGRFDRYDCHPITMFHNVEGDAARHSLVVTINTDDKGVFATSLENEFSLIAISLQKQRDDADNRVYTDLQIEEYLKRIAYYGNISRFTI